MAGASANYDTTTQAKRIAMRNNTKKFGPRVKPYFRQVGEKRRLGWICRAAGDGSWVVAEWANGLEKKRTIGRADDVSAANGDTVLTYEQALRIATNPVSVATAPVVKLTVYGAIELYCTNLAGRTKSKGKRNVAKEAETWTKNRLPECLGQKRVDQLSLTELRKWHTGLVRVRAQDDPDHPDYDEDDVNESRRKSKSTANRLLTNVKAALNEAFYDEKNGIQSDNPWRLVKPFRGVDGARAEQFDAAQVGKLVAAAATFDPCFADLCEVGFLVGARLGELARMNVKHFDAEAKTLRVPDGKTGPRTVTLTAQAVSVLTRICRNKLPAATLLPRADGERWVNTQHRPMQKALAIAGLTPDACFYTLRHSHISRAIEEGADLKLLGEQCGTSILMIQRNYAKVDPATRAQRVEEFGPKLEIVRAA